MCYKIVLQNVVVMFGMWEKLKIQYGNDYVANSKPVQKNEVIYY
jgi:hypothetical protein